MFCYKKIPLDNLKEIQKDLLSVIPIDYLKEEKLFYPKDIQSFFLSIPSLRETLNNLGWLDKLSSVGFALNILGPGNWVPIHIDSGDFDYSFNIPITDCRNTLVNFYNAESIEPTKFTNPKNTDATYYRFKKEDCRLIESLELTVPALVNVKIPHGVVNFSDKKRVTLLIRLSGTS